MFASTAHTADFMPQPSCDIQAPESCCAGDDATLQLQGAMQPNPICFSSLCYNQLFLTTKAKIVLAVWGLRRWILVQGSGSFVWWLHIVRKILHQPLRHVHSLRGAEMSALSTVRGLVQVNNWCQHWGAAPGEMLPCRGSRAVPAVASGNENRGLRNLVCRFLL